MKRKLMMLLMIVVLGSTTIGCTTKTTETVQYVNPTCEVPPLPNLPEVSAAELDNLSFEIYEKVIQRDRKLQDWALEMKAMLQVICNKENNKKDTGGK